ncbi:hypothetical protein SAMN05444274_104166 [Mariniphaga anaerophila]|uniref:Lipocalin-like domain-containing protein n=1 Tax=Mariniphaga anaerophila TaxID=1484053 RepID=A0A1M5A360_9BACT|nr:hypothetical protein [Mariniphaga anaerophila]SHF24718.1 hypothetical protein SAMN05444274_104166 [Mariniphaga anaerophila]
MHIKNQFRKIIQWLQTTEMFARPSQHIPGKWQLFEYYAEVGGELMNFKEDQLQATSKFLEIEFHANGNFIQHSDLELLPFSELNDYKWSLSRNFVVLIHPADFRQNIELQFAIDKGTLKILKKNSSGKIEFFGFFKKKNNGYNQERK